MGEKSSKTPRVAPHVSIENRRTVQRAKGGDPEALREILADLEASLRGKKNLDPAFGHYCADALKQLLGNSNSWAGAAKEFQLLDRSKVSVKNRVARQGPRLSPNTLKRIDNMFGRAFGLSKPQGKDAGAYHFLLTPLSVWKIFDLRLYGASLPHSTKIVRSVCDIKLSDRKVKEWFLRCSWLKLPEVGTHEFSCGQHHRRLKLAARLVHRTVRDMSFGEACSDVAKIAVTDLCFLPGATVHLKPGSVKSAYNYAVACGDPRWERAERLIRRFALQSQQVVGKP